MNTHVESGLVVFIPEAEALVARFRHQYDPSATLGVPAHVTVLYPFKPPQELTTDVLQRLSELFAKHSGFVATFTEARRFPNVLYLSPEPAELFQRLTESVAKRFPETPPYGGQFPKITPHLTVAQISEPERLQQVVVDFESVAKNRLPIQASVAEVVLMDNESGFWRVHTRFALGTTAGAN